MNINVGESQVIINEQINTQNSINRKTNIKELGYNFAKRAMDIIGGVFGVLALVPLTIIIYIANLISKDKGPIFYSQAYYPTVF